MITEWNIQSRGHGCEACAKSFADKESYHTMLFEERSELRRSDICAGCWEQQFSEARDKKGFISQWQGVYNSPPAQAPEAIQKETAETLLRKLIELNDPKHVPAAYILAVMLERKRLLKIKDQFTRDGLRVFVYEQPKTGDVFTIVDPNLQLNQLAQVQHDVANLLEHGFNPPAAPAENAPAEAPAPAAEPNAAAAAS
ncbi:MAG: hypothetical protein U1F65_02455 [Verrucomicrobiota bacterium]